MSQQERADGAPKVVSNQARAKVHKNLARYAEDSLDARMREVRENGPQ